MKYKINYKKNLIFVSLFLLSAFLLSYSFSFLGQQVHKIIVKPKEPIYKVYSSDPVDMEIIFNNEFGENLFSERIIREIDKAQYSLEAAVYSFTSSPIKEAIYRASERGVSVSLVLDDYKRLIYRDFFSDSPDNINYNYLKVDGYRKSLMHHKFAIIDRGKESQKLIFGSSNWTYLQEQYDRSFISLTDNKYLINSFADEFDRLNSSYHGIKKLSKKDYSPWHLLVVSDNSFHELWFSPGKNNYSVRDKIEELILSAKNDIKIMIWDFTDLSLADAVVGKARKGLKIQILTDYYNYYGEYSVFPYLLNKKEKYNLVNLEIVHNKKVHDKVTSFLADNSEIRDGLVSFFHYHVLIVDDIKVLFGTNNFSQSAFYYNDEAIMISNNKNIVDQFLDTFYLNYQEMTH